jgi:hypothetical protein
MSSLAFKHLDENILMFLIKESVDRFTKMFPNEDPFIKILVIRNKNRLEKNWRKIDYIDNGVRDVIEIKEETRYKKRTKRVKRTYERRAKAKMDEPIEVTQRRLDRAEHKIVKEELKDIYEKEEEVPIVEKFNACVEFHPEPLENEHQFIHVERNKHVIPGGNLYEENIVTSLKLNSGTFISRPRRGDMSTREEVIGSMVEASKGCDLEEELKISESKVNLEIIKVGDLERKLLEEVRKSKQLRDTKAEIESKLSEKFGSLSMEDAAMNYINLQIKLNNLKKQLDRFKPMYNDEMKDNPKSNWESLIKEHGFINSIPIIMKFFYVVAYDEYPPGDPARKEYDHSND